MEDVDISRFWTDDSSMAEMFPMIKLFNEMFAEQAFVLGQNLDVLDELKEMKFDVMIFERFAECAYRKLVLKFKIERNVIEFQLCLNIWKLKHLFHRHHCYLIQIY